MTPAETVSRQKLADIRHLALDMDGTIYSGKTLFDFTAEALEIFRKIDIGYTFLTNNSSRSVEDYLVKIRKLGLDAKSSQVYTSSLATIEYIKEHFSNSSKIFVFGTASLKTEFKKAGFDIITETDSDEPDIVVAGFDTELTYERMCKAAYWIAHGKTYIATHPDKICPTDEPTVLVDCGAVCACLKQATSREPDIVLGKPDVCMVEAIMRQHSLKHNQLAMVGDRLYTDIAMANKAGITGIAVLTGETKAEDIKTSSQQPDMVFENLLALAKALEQFSVSKN